MKNKIREKEHKKIVNYMKKVNKQLKYDEGIGSGRFRMDFYSENFHSYADGSGGYLFVIVKITDTLTGNNAYFDINNYNYDFEINRYTNDFLIRCACGSEGHYPLLHYLAYDVHSIVHYNGTPDEPKADYIVDKYDWR